MQTILVVILEMVNTSGLYIFFNYMTKKMNKQVPDGVSNVVLPLPNPPLVKGRGLDFPVSPKYIGGIKGGNLTCVYTVECVRGGN